MDQVENILFQLCNTHRLNGQPVTDALIDRLLDKAIDLFPEGAEYQINDGDRQRIKFNIQTRFNIDLSDGAIILRNPEVQRWFKAKRKSIEWPYWQAFEQYLIDQRRPVKILEENENVIDAILDLSGDPSTKGAWERRGLVMGNVQSGKTQNYLGLINKAIDAGYKIIIILGGHQNALRDQTQKRVDEGVTGRESRLIGKGKVKTVGVGHHRDRTKIVHSFTTIEKDFNKQFARSLGVDLNGLSSPAVFNVKKNVSVLKTLFEWIQNYHGLEPEENVRLRLPLLFIDDEADYASPNTKQASDDITATNAIIRDILSLFEKNTYVGYTATPFANIFIDPDNDDQMASNNLFPKDFMIRVPVPENYCGQDFFYGSDATETGELSPVRIIDDNELMLPLRGQKKEMVDDITDLCPSLKEAIRTFVISTAVRFLRGDEDEHHTMMINVTHLSLLQNKIRNLVGDYLGKLTNAVNATTGLPLKEAMEHYMIDQFFETFNCAFDIQETWDEIFPKLEEASERIQILALNVASKEVLDYDKYRDNGLVAIAIGGHKLSRGITLEGLSVSYFARNSKMYDTLMQMCRWFGYRPNYRDLCKVYMPEISLDWYKHISIAINELYQELELMRLQEKTPSEFGLKVRDHPDALIVTARNKMHTATARTVSVSLWGQRQRRYKWHDDEEENRRNLASAESFIVELESEFEESRFNDNPSRIFNDIPHQRVIDFIKAMGMISDGLGDSALISQIKKLEEKGLPNFKVCLRSQKQSRPIWWETKLGEQGDLYPTTHPMGSGEIILAKRTVRKEKNLIYRPGAELGEASDERIFLDPEEANRINGEQNGAATNFHYRRSPQRDFPTLLIYFFCLCTMHPYGGNHKKDQNLRVGSPGNYPFVGYAISFPILDQEQHNLTYQQLRAIQRDTKISYQTNEVYQTEFSVFGEPDDEDIDA